jgi:hypothetical protein
MSEYRFDIKTVSEANQREHWAVKSKRKKEQQFHFRLIWRGIHFSPEVNLPAAITFTRYSCRKMDSDNLAGAFKHVRDQLAIEIGIDDGSDRITWEYRQERTKGRENYFTVTVEHMEERNTRKAYAVILRTSDAPDDVAERIDSLGYSTIQIDQIDESGKFPCASEVVWQA